MKKGFYGIMIFILMMLFIPNVNAYKFVVITDFEYPTMNEEVEIETYAGLGAGPGTDFDYITKYTVSSHHRQQSFIDKYLLEQNNYQITVKISAVDEVFADYDSYEDADWIDANTSYPVIIKLGEYIVYENNITGQEILDGKKITLDLSNIPMNSRYEFNPVIKIDDSEEEYNNDYQIYALITDYGYDELGYFFDFFIGNKFTFVTEYKINDIFGMTYGIKNFFDAFDSFVFNYTLTDKTEALQYDLKLYHCNYGPTSMISNNDTCTLIDSAYNVNLNTKYFNTVVTEEYYKNNLANVDYIKFQISNDGNVITEDFIELGQNVVGYKSFVDYKIIDATGHNVKSDNKAYSNKLTLTLDGTNFNENDTYYLYASASSSDYYDEEMEYKTYSGKELNDGIDIELTTDKNNDGLYIFLESSCGHNYDDNCSEEEVYYAEHVTAPIQLIINDTIKTLTVKNLTVKGINYNQVKLDFDDVESATGYQIYRSTKKSSGYTLIGTSETSEYIDTKASVAKTYYYKVRAYNDSTGTKIYSKYSTVKSAKAKLLTTSATAKDSGYNSIKVTYEKVDGATGYQIYRATSKSGKYSLVKTTTSLSYTDKSLTTGKTYYYKVRAYKTISGKKYYSSYSTVQSAKPTVKAPTIKVESYDYNSNKITITAKPSGATGYAIYRSNSTDGTYSLLGTTTKTTYYDKNLETGKAYYYKVRAYRTVSGSKKYGYYTDIMESTPTLRTPTFAITNTSRDSLTLKIDKVNGATGYYIYEVINGIDNLIGYTENTTITYDNLTLGSEHTYKIVAARISDVENLSSPTTVTKTVKPAAINLTVDVNSFHTQTISSTLSEITEDDDVIVYLYQATSKDGEYSLIYEGIPNVSDTGDYILNTSVSGLRLNTTYYYKAIISINGVLSNESEISYKKAATKPDIIVLNYEYNKIIIGTTGDEEIDGYQVYRATSKNGKYTKVYDGTDNVTIIKGTFNKKYYYKIRYYKIYDGKKIYSEFSQKEPLKTGVSALDSYPLTLEGNFSDVKIKSTSFTYKKTSSSYVYYTFKINYSKTYATTKTKAYYTVRFLDWRTNQVYTYTLYDDIPKGTKKNWSSTFTIKIPKTAVYFYFE